MVTTQMEVITKHIMIEIEQNIYIYNLKLSDILIKLLSSLKHNFNYNTK